MFLVYLISTLHFNFPQSNAMSFCQWDKKIKNFIHVISLLKTLHPYPSFWGDRRPTSFLWLPGPFRNLVAASPSHTGHLSYSLCALHIFLHILPFVFNAFSYFAWMEHPTPCLISPLITTFFSKLYSSITSSEFLLGKDG